MSELPVPVIQSGQLGPDQLSEAAAAYADAGMAENTRRAFRSSLKGFVSWCASVGRRPLPADALTVAEYLTARAPDLTVSTLALHLAAIRKAHELAGLDAPHGPAIDRVWSGIRKTHGRPPRRKRAVSTAQLRRFVSDLQDPASLRALRDRAILLLGFAGALRRSELVALQLGAGDIRAELVGDGVEIHLDRSKGDQSGAGQIVAIPYGETDLCPVAALQAWISRAEISTGFVFRRVDRRGQLGDGRVSDRYVARLVQRAARRCGLDPASFGGHSLRAGLATEAAKRGVALATITGHLRHSSPRTTMAYIRDGERFKRNAAAKVGL